jgi:hypothetical protein
MGRSAWSWCGLGVLELGREISVNDIKIEMSEKTFLKARLSFCFASIHKGGTTT